MEEVEKRTKPIRDKLGVKQAELAPIVDLKNGTQAKIKDVETEIDLIQKKIAKTKDSYVEALKYIEKVRKEKDDLKQTGKMYAFELSKAHEQSTVLMNEVSKWSKEAASFEKEYAQKQDLYNRKKIQFSAQGNQDENINRLLQAQKDGDLSGIFGRLGDLATVPADVDIAASTAGCKYLNHILVANGKAGEECIKYLKKHKLGRARFLLLDRAAKYQKYLQMPESTPEQCPRVLDFIECEDMFRNAFAQAYGNTLLCQDMDQANRAAYGEKRWRCVTRRGNLVEKSGMMTGGGRPLKGLIKVQGKRQGKKGVPNDWVTQEDLDKLKTELDEIDSQIKSAKGSQRKLERAVEQEKKIQSEWELKCRQIDMQYKGKKKAETEKKATLSSLKEAAENTQKEDAEIAKLKSKMGDLVSEKMEHEKQCRVVQQQIGLLQAEIRKEGGAKVEELQHSLRRQEQHLEELTNRINEQKVNKTSGVKTIAQTQGKIDAQQKKLQELEQKYQALEARKKELEALSEPILEELKNLQTKELEEESKLKELRDGHNAKKDERVQIVKNLRVLKKEVSKIKTGIEQLRENIAEREAKVDILVRQIQNKQRCFDDTDRWKLPEKTEEALGEIYGESEHYPGRIRALKKEVEESNINQTAILAWQRKEEEYAKQNEKYAKMEAQRSENNRKLCELRDRRTQEFLTGFTIITRKLKEMYQLLTFGGDADLELVDSHDPFSEGIVFTVRPPKKSWKDIQNISGGEKTLSSLSLVFALHHYQPAALYVMDEIDAALDFRNVSIVANYIKRETQNAQFIIISLRNQMFDLSNRMVGIYKIDNSTQSITYNPNGFNIGKVLQDAREEPEGVRE